MTHDPISYLLDLFGSHRALAEAAGTKVGGNATYNWRAKGIPDDAKWRLLLAARARQLPLVPELLEDNPPKEALRAYRRR